MKNQYNKTIAAYAWVHLPFQKVFLLGRLGRM